MKRNEENLIDHSVLFMTSMFETGCKTKIVTKHDVIYLRHSALALINKACMRCCISI